MAKPSEYITDLFHKLREDISWIKHRLFTEQAEEKSDIPLTQYTIDAVHTDGNSGEKKNDTIRATLNLPKTIRIEAQTEERQKPWYHDRTVWLQIAGIFVGCAVAVIYYLQWKSMQDSVNTSRKSSEREARAIVNLKQIGGLQLVPNKTIELPARVNNLGKTTAGRVVVAAAVELVPRLESPHLKDSDVLPLYRSEMGGIFPSDHTDFNIVGQKGKGQMKKGGDTENHILSDTDLADLKAGNTYVAIHGRVAYDDVFHVRHWTQFCFWWSFTSLDYNAYDCTAYNAQDDQDEP